MKLSEAFPSNFLKADDLQGKSVTVTISDVQLEDIGKGHEMQSKVVLSFKGKEKKFVCNKTNAKTIAKLHGDDTDDWIGKSIIIEPREVEFQGDMVWAIRVSLKKPAGATKAPEPEPENAPEDDEIPF